MIAVDPVEDVETTVHSQHEQVVTEIFPIFKKCLFKNLRFLNLDENKHSARVLDVSENLI